MAFSNHSCSTRSGLSPGSNDSRLTVRSSMPTAFGSVSQRKVFG